jgi:hypothetical protein
MRARSLSGTPRKLADDGDRQRVGKRCDHIHGRSHRKGDAQKLVSDLLDPRPETVDLPGSERLADRLAQACVVRWIGVQHRAPEPLLQPTDSVRAVALCVPAPHPL